MPKSTIPAYITSLMGHFEDLRDGMNTDPKTVQAMLRHADVSTTLGLYTHANTGAKLAAQGAVLKEFFAQAERAS